MSKPDRPFDVAVVGAGPAGAYLAQKLAAAGVKVALFDPAAPWEKPCGGGITHKAWSRFPILADSRLPRYEALSSVQVTSTGRFFVIDEGHPLLIVNRRELSELMLQSAVDAGAQHLPLAIDKVETWGTKYRLLTATDDFFADFVVGADGVNSVVRRTFLGPLPKHRTLSSLIQFYEPQVGDPTMIHVTPFPGYAWAFPRRDRLCVGVGAMEHGHNLKPVLEQFITRFFPGRKPISDLQGAPLPFMYDRAAYKEPRVGEKWALLGDAAGFCDTLTGEGILYAVWSADLLADAYLAGKPRQYDKAWRKQFGRHLRSGAWAGSRLYSPRNIDRLFTAITVCPSFRRQILEFVWNLPPYHILARRLLLAMPQVLWQWRRFIKEKGGVIDESALGEFSFLADRLTFHWDK